MPRNCTVAESKKLSVAQLYGNTEALWGRMRCKCSQSQKQQDAKTDAPVQLSSVESPDLLIFIFIFCLRNHRVISVGKDLQDHQVSSS